MPPTIRRYEDIYQRQKRYTAISRAAGKLNATLADMNTLSEGWHRDSDFAELLQQVQAALGILGEPGIGKSRLARAVAAKL